MHYRLDTDTEVLYIANWHVTPAAAAERRLAVRYMSYVIAWRNR